jgi:hypothetical protein
MVMGFGASFGILGFIISVLTLRERKNREYNDDIYIEPVPEIENNENIGDEQYETICDTLYELAGNKSDH